ncbi:MAG: hypothetical protein HZC37_27515 [Burkholderiales bacterium]|nr:hypothetical protein [Burkholderiales bacterium]
MGSFAVLWPVSALVILALGVLAGCSATGKVAGILIDSRGRCSLTHVQVVAWTVLILSAFAATLVASNFDLSKAKLSTDLLGLMGIAAGSAVLSTGVKAVKDAPGSAAKVARDGTAVPAVGTAAATTIRVKFAQIWLEEEGDFADRVVSITKFQNFIFTLVALATFVSLAMSVGGLPTAMPENFLALLGISHAGYVGGKIPDKK